MTQPELAAKLDTTTGYVNHMITGKRKPSAEWVDLIADTLRLSERKRVELHRAAARDHGFKLDLTKPK